MNIEIIPPRHAQRCLIEQERLNSLGKITPPLAKYSWLGENSYGSFGAIRKYDIHTGIDLYCKEGDFVYAIEDGIIIDSFYFTGISAGSPWWNDTKAITVEGKSGVILYGEINPYAYVGCKVKKGDVIGTVVTVLKKDKGRPMNMLHLELYKKGYRGQGETWLLNQNKPNMLLDPTNLIFNTITKNKKNIFKLIKYKISKTLDVDFNFFAIIPAINLNFHNNFTLEIEWLFFALYIDIIKNE